MSNIEMNLSDYDYHLPEELIAQVPIIPRDYSRMMVLDREKGTIEDRKFYNILDYLKEGDILVRNSTKVIPARLIGKKDTGGIMEMFLIKRIGLKNWEVLLKPAKKLKLGQKLYFGEDSELVATLDEIKDDANRVMSFEYDGVFEEILDRLGQMPLPPYIGEKLSDKNRYQTVYAKRGESVAAPTAGLHFTEELLEKIKEKGVEIVDVYLEVGLGTFRPVQTENILEHKMHSEKYEVPQQTADIINEGKRQGRRIIAVGTTSVRTLESSVDSDGKVLAGKSDTEIFIYPGYKFKVLDALITNFHLPKSTLLMLISAFAGKDFIFEAYERAVKEKYRFFSFGDSMFIY
jgi:S-adenosylmethionine:tRNA ribosyltransferase-isomerase